MGSSFKPQSEMWSRSVGQDVPSIGTGKPISCKGETES